MYACMRDVIPAFMKPGMTKVGAHDMDACRFCRLSVEFKVL